MRAVVVDAFGPPEACTLREVPDPVPGPGEVLIDIRACGVNYPDLLVIDGSYQFKPDLPFTPGKEAAGDIAALGAGVTALKTGDRVMVQVERGAFAEKIVAKADQCFVMPPSMDYPTGASMGLVYQTAWFALTERAGLKPGDYVLVSGATGGVGLAALQIAKALGAVTLAGVASPSKAAAIRAAGADHVIDLAASDLRDSLRAQVQKATGGHGADIFIDPVGGDVFDAGLRALAWRGRAVVVGFAAGRIPTIKANYLLVKNIGVSGLQWSDYRDRTPDWMQEAQAAMFRLFEEGRLTPLVSRAYPLAQVADALNLIRDRKVEGKVVLTT